MKLFVGKWYLGANQFFDGSQCQTFAGRAERKGDSLRAGSPGATDSMDIAFRFARKVEVDDVGDAVNVDSPSGDVRRHQHLHLFALERRQRPLPGALRLVPVNCRGFDPTSREPFGKILRAPLRSGEHQGAIDLRSHENFA